MMGQANWRKAGGLALIAALALAGCEREVILPGERFPVRSPLDASIPTEDNPSPVAPPEEPANQSRPIGLPAASERQGEEGCQGENAQH